MAAPLLRVMAPALAAQRFALSCCLGLAVGAWYDFLRPLRRGKMLLADLLFAVGALWLWLVQSFGICKGDLRLIFLAGLWAGAAVWEWRIGVPFRPVFRVFWEFIGKIGGIALLPAKKFLQFLKILFASVEKWVTIWKIDCRSCRKPDGGSSHGKRKVEAGKGADYLEPRK